MNAECVFAESHKVFVPLYSFSELAHEGMTAHHAVILFGRYEHVIVALVHVVTQDEPCVILRA